MQPDHTESVRFLRALYATGPWLLTAISVDKKQIESRNFEISGDVTPETLADALGEITDWLNLHRRRNLYYSVNQATQEAYKKKKLAKTDVLSVHYLHVDVDPRVPPQGEDPGLWVEKEQARILKQIEDYRIPPSEVVFSGGGYNAVWRLASPLPIALDSPDVDETVRRAVDLERRNWQFELDFSTPDHCRDCSRILRLPGTINWPNEEKVKKGRTPSLARWIKTSAAINQDTGAPDANYAYEYGRFMATPLVAANSSHRGQPGSAAHADSTSHGARGDAMRLESIDDPLLSKIPDKLKVLIAQGHDPDEPTKWADRSGLLFHVCCELVRYGVENPVILGIITDSRFAISVSVLDKGSGVQRYAQRQVDRARDKAEHPMLETMNEQFAVILSYGSSPVIMSERGRRRELSPRTSGGQPQGQINGAQMFMTPSVPEYEPVFQNFRSFKDRVKNFDEIPLGPIGPKGREKTISAYEWWTAHRRRRTYEDVVFAPGMETPDRYNLWTGFSVAPIPGDQADMFLEHVRENICNGNPEHYAYLIQWMARVVQQPRTSSMVAVVLLGERGTGKSIFCDYFGAIFDPHRYVASDIADLTGKFNSHLSQSLLLVGEEAFDLRDKRHESVLKELITGKKFSVERKGIDKVMMANYTHLIMTSNSDRVVPAGDHERRFFVLRVGSHRRQNSAYFREIIRQMRDNGGVGNLLHHLMTIDLTNFDVTAAPRTEELRKQQEHNLTQEMDWLLSKLSAGQWFGDGTAKWEGPVRKKKLHLDYLEAMKSVSARHVRGDRAFHRFIMDALPGTRDYQAQNGRDASDRPMVFEFPPLSVCREAWDRARGWSTAWLAPQVLLETGPGAGQPAVAIQTTTADVPGGPTGRTDTTLPLEDDEVM